MVKAIVFDLARTLLFPKDKTWEKGVNDLYGKVANTPGFKFFDYFEVSGELSEYIKSLQGSLPVYMFTSEFIQNDPAIKDDLSLMFKKIYSAAEMGVSKKDPAAYKSIAEDIGVDTSEVLFVDDSAGNVEAARVAGMQTVQYKDSSVISLVEKTARY